jgi:hypothetical protein
MLKVAHGIRSCQESKLPSGLKHSGKEENIQEKQEESPAFCDSLKCSHNVNKWFILIENSLIMV